jgi:flagellar protein FliS
MYQMGINRALQQYHHAGVAEASEADPHRLIQMLLEGALQRIAIARGAMQQGNVAVKGDRLSSAISIIEGLRSHLDMERGGEIAANLEALYDYMQQRLLQANLRNDEDILEEVAGLLRQIKSAWDAIPQQQPAA